MFLRFPSTSLIQTLGGDCSVFSSSNKTTQFSGAYTVRNYNSMQDAIYSILQIYCEVEYHLCYCCQTFSLIYCTLCQLTYYWQKTSCKCTFHLLRSLKSQVALQLPISVNSLEIFANLQCAYSMQMQYEHFDSCTETVQLYLAVKVGIFKYMRQIM